MREQFIVKAIQVRGQSGQHVVEVCVWIIAIELRRLHEAHDDSGTLAPQ